MTLLAASTVGDILYETRVGPAALVLVVAGLVLAAAMHALKAHKSASLQRRVQAQLDAASIGEPRAIRERARRTLASLREATERRLAGTRPWESVGRIVARSGLRLGAADFLYVAAGCGLAAALGVVFLGASTGLAVIALAMGLTAPFAVAVVLARRRERAFDEQLPDVLLTLASSLKVGHSFSHALRAVAERGQAPASEEFGRVLAEMELGKTIDVALADLAQRVRSKNLEFALTAVTIQREIGGSLAGLFETVAEVVRERQQLARKLRSLTAMGRASAFVLIALPFAAALGLTAINGDYMEPLYTTSIGHTLIGTGLVMISVGSLLLKRIVSTGR